MPAANVIAILISDLHLSLLRPACRADKDWMATQAFYLKQVRETAEDLPVICAGDIFDRWNPPPELINFALRNLPDGMLCVPGQHDLPNHRMDGMHRSGYGVLVEAEKIVDLTDRADKDCLVRDGMVIRGFGWNQEIEPPVHESLKMPKAIHLAVIHRYCWTEEKKYPGAAEEANVSAYKKQLKGYNVAVFGDNHLRFMAEAGNCKVVNCGGFSRRKSDELFRKPCMALLYSDGTVTWKKLDLSMDEFYEDVEDRPEVPVNMRDFIKGLESLGEDAMDFRLAVENHLRKDDIDEGIKEIILKSLEAHGT